MYDVNEFEIKLRIKLNHNINMIQTFPYTGFF